jgi:Ca-activated chloride channel family protein
VYQDLGSQIELSRRETELTALLAGLAAVLLIAGVGLSVWWFGSSGRPAPAGRSAPAG